jgi:hypothetical protein
VQKRSLLFIYFQLISIKNKANIIYQVSGVVCRKTEKDKMEGLRKKKSWSSRETERQRDRQTDRQRDRETDIIFSQIGT